MEKEKYRQFVSELPLLTTVQLSDLTTRVKLLSKTIIKNNAGKQDFGIRVLYTICDVMKKNNVECPSISVLQRSSAYVSSVAKINDLAEFFESISKSKIVQDQILREAINLLYHDLLQWQGISISSHTILKQIHRIPSVLNKSFPGYAASGLLVKIVKGAS